MPKDKKKPFGGYALSFAGQKATVEEVMGSKDITPAQMTKKLWDFVKANGLGSKG